ncbi:CrcB family protein [Bifidobacterium scardovii]|uniref:CrcB family protein n=1 Tax=Bifidobacterium scardovii TaxID=158787 RepID=UPI0036F460CE
MSSSSAGAQRTAGTTGDMAPSTPPVPSTPPASPAPFASKRRPDIRLDLLAVVFAGGTIGTAIRYLFTQVPPSGAFHTGTLIANLLACLCYAGLTAYLAASPRIGSRGKELASRGLGMGMCGGLSTMSTLALECFTAIRSGQAAAGIGYLAATFAAGLAAATFGAWAGTRLAAQADRTGATPLRKGGEAR